MGLESLITHLKLSIFPQPYTIHSCQHRSSGTNQFPQREYIRRNFQKGIHTLYVEKTEIQ